MDVQNIVMIGSGGVATHLGLGLHHAGHRILQVYSPNLSHARQLGTRIDAAGISDLQELDTTADLYIIAITDKAISPLAASLPPDLSCVVHTSGTTDIKVLSGRFRSWGVIYPLQTFSRERKVDMARVPLLLEADQEQTLIFLENCMRSMSLDIRQANSRQRAMLHIAAVFACNFTNHFYALADDLLQESGMSFDLLHPLITETASKATRHTPASVQTGPAVRNDTGTLQRHLELLAGRPELLRLYALISESIAHNTPRS